MAQTKDILIIASLLTAVGTGVFVYTKIAKKRKENLAKKETKEYDKQTYTTKKGGTTTTINLVETSDTIANGLGINKGWYNPTSWTENDTDVYNAIKIIPKSLIGELSKIYATKYKRNLRTDLNEFLDSELYVKIKPLLI